METATILLALAALGGLTLAVIRLRGAALPPTWMAIAHGVVAAAGLSMLVFACFEPATPWLAKLSASVIFLAAIGGVVMFSGFHLRGKALPIPFVIAHGLLATTGFAMLVINWLQIR